MTKAITIDNTNDLFKIMSDRKNIKGEYEIYLVNETEPIAKVNNDNPYRIVEIGKGLEETIGETGILHLIHHMTPENLDRDMVIRNSKGIQVFKYHYNPDERFEIHRVRQVRITVTPSTLKDMVSNLMEEATGFIQKLNIGHLIMESGNKEVELRRQYGKIFVSTIRQDEKGFRISYHRYMNQKNHDDGSRKIKYDEVIDIKTEDTEKACQFISSNRQECRDITYKNNNTMERITEAVADMLADRLPENKSEWTAKHLLIANTIIRNTGRTTTEMEFPLEKAVSLAKDFRNSYPNERTYIYSTYKDCRTDMTLTGKNITVTAHPKLKDEYGLLNRIIEDLDRFTLNTQNASYNVSGRNVGITKNQGRKITKKDREEVDELKRKGYEVTINLK